LTNHEFEAELPDLAFLVLMTFSWPLVAGHAAQVLSADLG